MIFLLIIDDDHRSFHKMPKISEKQQIISQINDIPFNY